MKRALAFCMALSICFIALGLKPEERPLAKKVDHIFITSAQAQEPANPLLGTGLGVDHVGIAGRDLKKTRDDYEHGLGFKCIERPPQPSGVVSNIIYFENTSYLELLSVSQEPSGTPLSGQAKRYADFAKKHEGAVFLGLATSSAKNAVDYLKTHDFEAFLLGAEGVMKEGQPKPPPPPWYGVAISDEPSGNKKPFPLAVFLIEYVSPERLTWIAGIRESGMMDHPNTARRLHSVWFAVRDLEAALRNLRDAGFESGEPRDAEFLEARGREIQAGTGTMILLQAVNDKSALSEFLSYHDDGSIVGVSIEVADLDKARSWIESRSGQKLEPYDGFYGRSIMIPPDMTHGFWMEMFQR